MLSKLPCDAGTSVSCHINIVSAMDGRRYKGLLQCILTLKEPIVLQAIQN
jgi:hypothetical protein